MVEEFDRDHQARGKQNVATVVNAASKLITDRGGATGASADRPATGASVRWSPPPPPPVPSRPRAG